MNGREPAFPKGLTKREYAAIHIAAAIVPKMFESFGADVFDILRKQSKLSSNTDIISSLSTGIADAVLSELAKGEPK